MPAAFHPVIVEFVQIAGAVMSVAFARSEEFQTETIGHRRIFIPFQKKKISRSDVIKRGRTRRSLLLQYDRLLIGLINREPIKSFRICSSCSFPL